MSMEWLRSPRSSATGCYHRHLAGRDFLTWGIAPPIGIYPRCGSPFRTTSHRRRLRRLAVPISLALIIMASASLFDLNIGGLFSPSTTWRLVAQGVDLMVHLPVPALILLWPARLNHHHAREPFVSCRPYVTTTARA